MWRPVECRWLRKVWNTFSVHTDAVADMGWLAAAPLQPTGTLKPEVLSAQQHCDDMLHHRQPKSVQA